MASGDDDCVDFRVVWLTRTMRGWEERMRREVREKCDSEFTENVRWRKTTVEDVRGCERLVVGAASGCSSIAPYMLPFWQNGATCGAGSEIYLRSCWCSMSGIGVGRRWSRSWECAADRCMISWYSVSTRMSARCLVWRVGGGGESCPPEILLLFLQTFFDRRCTLSFTGFPASPYLCNPCKR